MSIYNPAPMAAPVDEQSLKIATTWFLAARAMAVADGNVPQVKEAAAGLYARAILMLSEEVCLRAKDPDVIGSLTLIDCLGQLAHLPREVNEQIMTGVMMIAYASRQMHPLEVRWASTMASAMKLSEDDFQRCCVGSRVIATMLNPSSSSRGGHD